MGEKTSLDQLLKSIHAAINRPYHNPAYDQQQIERILEQSRWTSAEFHQAVKIKFHHYDPAH